MDNVIMTLDEKQMEVFIKDLLCLDDGGSWNYITVAGKGSINFSGNIYTVQKKIYEWLSIPPRRNNFELFANKPAPKLSHEIVEVS